MDTYKLRCVHTNWGAYIQIELRTYNLRWVHTKLGGYIQTGAYIQIEVGTYKLRYNCPAENNIHLTIQQRLVQTSPFHIIYFFYIQAARYSSEIMPDTNWPHGGAVELRNYSCRYRDGLDLVLNNVSCKIKAGEKVNDCISLHVFFLFSTCTCYKTISITR